MRSFFFMSGTGHPDDCPCGKGKYYDGKEHHTEQLNGVCFVGNVGAHVKDLDVLGLDWKRQVELATAPGTNEHEFEHSTWKLPDDADAHYRALRISRCRPWCCLHGQDRDHTWCVPFENDGGFIGGAGI